MADLRLTSPAFDHDGDLPARHTADSVSPPLVWEGVPDGTEELVLICDDPDADEGVFTYWIVYGIPADATGLPEGLSRDVVVNEPVELVQGLNDFDEAGYTGPVRDDDAPVHRCFFRLFALDTELLDVPPGAGRAELRKASEGHVIAATDLVAMI